MRAGVDRREQKKAAAAHEQQILRKMRESMVGLLNPCMMPLIAACNPRSASPPPDPPCQHPHPQPYGHSLFAKSGNDHKCMLTSQVMI